MRIAMRAPDAGPWSPGPQVHLARVDDDLVFLDLRRDRYQCLPAPGAAWDADTQILRLAEPELAAELVRAGLIRARDGAPPRAVAALPPRPLETLVPARAEPVRWGDAREAARAWLEFVLIYRGRSLAGLIAAAARSRPSAPGEAATANAVARAFHRWLPYAALPPKCLVRSFLLLRALHRAGCDATWVFGVKTWPFRAHCWLQRDGLVLDDDLEAVRAYAPILAV